MYRLAFMVAFYSVVGALFGLAVGSFFNVLIYRMPAGLNLWWPPSACPQCGNRIRARHNVPVLGWLMLRGRCYDCSLPISSQYPVVEALCGFLGAISVIWANAGGDGMSIDWPVTLTLGWLLLTLVPITMIDVQHGLIPDSLSIGAVVFGLGISFLPGGLDPLHSILGAVLAGGGLWTIGFIFSKILKRDAMGFGDVKLIAGFGALLGTRPAFITLAFASFLGLVGALAFRNWGKGGAHSLPFGPFLQLGAIVYVVAGEAILTWYFSLFRFL